MNGLIDLDTVLIEVAIATGGSCELLDLLELLLSVLHLVGGCHCRGAKLIYVGFTSVVGQDLVFSGLVTGGRIQKFDSERKRERKKERRREWEVFVTCRYIERGLIPKQ